MLVRRSVLRPILGSFAASSSVEEGPQSAVMETRLAKRQHSLGDDTDSWVDRWVRVKTTGKLPRVLRRYRKSRGYRIAELRQKNGLLTCKSLTEALE
jgi:hypothetical protein